MKIALKLANGATLDFEGDAEEFERLSAFLEEPPDSLTAGVPAGLLSAATGGSGDGSTPAPLDPETVAGRLEQVGARTDQERVTVMAQLAMESGKEGIDYGALEHLFAELALRKPARFPTATLANAKASGLVRMVKPGIWRTTHVGENFAKGHGRLRRPGSRPKSSKANGGGESD